MILLMRIFAQRILTMKFMDVLALTCILAGRTARS